METPARFKEFNCDDYFASRWAEAGHWDEASQLMLVVPSSELRVRTEVDFLVIGRPGVDGIEFGYRRGMTGVWAHHPMEREFVAVAPSTEELVEGYLAGRITV